MSNSLSRAAGEIAKAIHRQSQKSTGSCKAARKLAKNAEYCPRFDLVLETRMPPPSSQLKSKRESATPRLLSRLPWFLPLVLVLSVAGLYAASKRPKQQTRPVRAAELHELPREPPVELLSVPNSGFPCAVDDVLEAKCRRCHTRPMRNGAPFPLLTWNDTRLFVRADAQVHLQLERVVKGGSMPPRILANPPVEPLTADEKWVLLEWVSRGAPRGTCP